MLLNNKTAIITGAANGLGLSMAEQFINEGCKVIAVDIVDCPIVLKGKVSFHKLDVSNYEACKKFSEECFNSYGSIDILINNAGITRDSLTKKMDEEQFDKVISVNLKGVWNLTKFIGPEMQKSGKGSIINISSIVGEYGNIGQSNYSAAKAGIIGMSKTWAKEFSFKGADVRVNVIAPGYTLTDILKTVPQDLLETFANQTMLGRLGKPHEIANAALFLASDLSSYVTGTVLDVNGGMRL